MRLILHIVLQYYFIYNISTSPSITRSVDAEKPWELLQRFQNDFTIEGGNRSVPESTYKSKRIEGTIMDIGNMIL